MGFFTPAEVSKSKLRLGLAGPSKSGKSWSALLIAETLIAYLEEIGQLEGNGLISLTDSEHRSARKHAWRFKFYDKDLNVFHPDNYIQHLEESEREGFSVHIFDSLSHEWSGRGGALDLHGKLTEQSRSKNSYVAWRDVTPVHNALIDRIIRSNLHVICTMRSKVAYVIKDNSVQKIGMRPIQRKDTEYEFDSVGHMDAGRTAQGFAHHLRFEGSRCPALSGRVFANLTGKPGEIDEVGKILGEWLTMGQSPQPEPTPILSQVSLASLMIVAGELLSRLGTEWGSAERVEEYWRAVLGKRGVTRAEDLTEEDAAELTANIERKLATMRLREQFQAANVPLIQDFPPAPSGGDTPPSQSFVPQPQHDLSTLTESVNRTTAAIEIGSGPLKPTPQNPPQSADTQAQLPLSSSLGGVATGGRGDNGPIEQMNEVIDGIVTNIQAAQPAERLPDPPWDDAASNTLPDATQGQGQGDGKSTVSEPKRTRQTRPSAKKGG